MTTPDLIDRARQLAQELCPVDVKEFGARHALPTFAEVTWQTGFIQGYLEAAGVRRDGKTSVTDGIRQLAAPQTQDQET